MKNDARNKLLKFVGSLITNKKDLDKFQELYFAFLEEDTKNILELIK